MNNVTATTVISPPSPDVFPKRAGNRARRMRWGAALLAAFFLAGCAETQLLVHTAKRISGPPAESGGTYKVGNPYQIKGQWYYPREDYTYVEEGVASWYGPGFHGRTTANGETYDQNALTAAHRTLPMPSVVRVTNLENGRSLVVRINDRGPFADGRIIDMSRRGAQLLGFERQGIARVRVEIMAAESLAMKEVALAGGNTEDMRRIMAQAGARSESNEGAPSASPVQRVEIRSITPPPESGPAQTAVVRQPVTPSGGSVYIQAGAFSVEGNAERTRVGLAGLGPVSVDPVRVGETSLYRVRLGPFQDDAAASAVLEQVIGQGFPDARLISEH